MKFPKSVFFIFVLLLGFAANAGANERLFTYTYEPETMPQGGWELENQVTWRAIKNQTVGKGNYHKFKFRQELEYGVTDLWTTALYLNESNERFRDTVKAENFSESKFEGVSWENRYQVWNPAEHKVGLALYLEPTFSSDATELEEKIIIGQRNGDWKWAFNISHETEWPDEGDTEGKLEFDLGISKELNKSWSLGIEVKNDYTIENYKKWEDTALFVGPAVNYRVGNWWATLTALGQVYGNNFLENGDGLSNFELNHHEYVNVRCIIGVSF